MEDETNDDWPDWNEMVDDGDLLEDWLLDGAAPVDEELETMQGEIGDEWDGLDEGSY